MTVPNLWRSDSTQDAQVSSPTSRTNDAKMLFNSFQGVSCNANLFKGPVLDDGFSSSQRYIPNEHHRVVAHASVDSARDLTLQSEGKAGHKSLELLPSISQQTITSQNFDYYMPSEQYSRCQSSQFLHESAGGSNHIFDWKLSNLEISSMHASEASTFSPTKDSSIIKESSVGCGLELPKKNSIQQSSLALGSTLPSKYTLVHDSKREQLCQNKQKDEHSEPSLPRPHAADIHFDKHALLRIDQCQRQQYIRVGNTYLSPLSSESISNGSCLMNNNNLLEKAPVQSLVVHDMIKQQQPTEMEQNALLQNTELKEASFGEHSTIPRRPVQYQAIHNLLFLYEHVINCQNEGNDCSFFRCTNLKRVLSHHLHCKDANCTKRCYTYKRLFDHYRECTRSLCIICDPVRRRVKEVSHRNISNTHNESNTGFPTVLSLEHEESSFKRAKTVHCGENEIYEACIRVMNHRHISSDGKPQTGPEVRVPIDTNTGYRDPLDSCMDVDANTGNGQLKERQGVVSILRNSGETYSSIVEEQRFRIKEGCGDEPAELTQVVAYSEEVFVQLGSPNVGSSDKCHGTIVTSANVIQTPQRVISLLDTFTPEKLREHIRSLQQHGNLVKETTDKSQNLEHYADQNSCSLCQMEKLTFEVPLRYCSSCYKQINPKGVYYIMRSSQSTTYECGAKISFCGKCYGAYGDNIKVGRQVIQKSYLERRLNYAETDAETEWWVQCDKCKAWQHQICALFNGKRMEALHSEYICPNCYLDELESGKHGPLPHNAVIGAEDLPKTMLSDHIEQWVFKRLREEREERARTLKKSVDEVPCAEGLIIRVVSTIDKKLEVNPGFLEVFKEMYPRHFPYKSKVILLFQKIEGADVCLFGMYVQEYGSECAFPNQRHVCISYIDSVKYFRPEIKAATGEALRTFVYHEILIGYLDYCKKQGFTSCYIWACPSLRQDYYILHCHPKTQKTPKSDKLREWYQSMIRKAIKEKVVLEHTNLYDHFFVLTTECKAKITAARLPYFDNDFWPGKAEILLLEDKNESHAKGTKAVIERALRAAKRDASTRNPKDILLMHQLGEIIRPIKEDFIMIHLQHTCKYCYHPILSGKRWVCNTCKNFQLCEQCHDQVQNLDKKDRHPVTAKEKHSFSLVESDILAETCDPDEVMQSKLFDMRTGFLCFCQSEQYQFDTLRRAKHSTMMILYHLHNPSVPVLTSSCAMCHSNIDSGQNWHCMVCQGYYLCDSCYHRNGAFDQKHQLVSHTATAYRAVQPNQQRNGKLNIQVVLDALLHAPRCFAPQCGYPFCLKVKKLFLHSRKCTVRYRGGCIPCRKIWLLLQRHTYTCRESDCSVPRCKDLKDYVESMRQQPEMERINQGGEAP